MSSNLCSGVGNKLAWPELVGEQVSVAVATIHRENSYVQPVVIPEGIPLISLEYRCDRVRVWVEGSIVSRVPYVG
ncbi:hypothetical protein Sjap_003589 [Stephania japonica]|uniref:Glu S.griseus protease inhibitor n=1 Tax=Stephania japonica TaxID=461633 RepID=A0AAP0KQT0_9MAGN